LDITAESRTGGLEEETVVQIAFVVKGLGVFGLKAVELGT
jgi:hypothetical protein